MGLCAIGLVLIPELVYVRDIYENGNARANTMFKLTYQAYIMFGMTMIYAIFRLLIIGKNKILKALAVIGLILFVWTVVISETVYMPGSVKYGNRLNIKD